MRFESQIVDTFFYFFAYSTQITKQIDVTEFTEGLYLLKLITKAGISYREFMRKYLMQQRFTKPQKSTEVESFQA